jgi:acetyl/propionyl-CoA carboxylase alpha subunit
VQDADEAINIGSIDQSDRNPFLDIGLLVQTALSTGAQAIHPGYGYLSENADFANCVREGGLIFIGPSASAMSTLGDKRSSKEYLRTHAPDVPLIPGFSGSSQDDEALRKAAHDIGFPVMLKASAGGGGKGMRIVREAGELKPELERAQSEAQRSFGSSDCILEKYIESSKHVEIQILGDSHGEVISFFDRDCSVQRRHQKVIEETPCPFLTDKTRKEMSDTAVRIAKLIGYENAGTVEFVVDVKTGHFYFLEVNARLQVEHPITEEVTGMDLVSLQLFVAAGGNLKTLPAVLNVTQQGHAIECRLCAEDPQKNFFPEHGKVSLWLPASGALGNGRDVRYETAIQTGSTVSIYFDSMIAKIVVWAPTRPLAVEKMAKILAHTACVGVKTNQLFMQACVLNQAFRDPAYTTSFIPTHLDELLQPPWTQNLPEMEKMISVLPGLVVRKLPSFIPTSLQKKSFGSVRKQFRNQRFDPVSVHCDIVTAVDWPGKRQEENNSAKTMCIWKPEAAQVSGNIEEAYLVPIEKIEPSHDESAVAATQVSAQYNNISQALRGGKTMYSKPYRASIDSWLPAEGNPAMVDSWLASTIQLSINGTKILAHVTLPSARPHTLVGEIDRGQRIFCHLPALGTYVEFKRDTLLSFAESIRSVVKANNGPEEKTVTAPMPCKVLSILKNNGDEIKPGETVMVIESMKMELSIAVSASGKFETSWNKGDAVEEGKILCSVV